MENKNLQEVEMILTPGGDTGGNGSIGGGGTGDTGGDGGSGSDDPKKQLTK